MVLQRISIGLFNRVKRSMYVVLKGDSMRIVLKILHTLAAAGMLGGLLAYFVLLLASPQDSASAVLDMRLSILSVCNYLIVPSLVISLTSGLLSMIVHKPFMDKGWALVKALMGILMVKAVLGLVGAKASAAADFAKQIAAGEMTEVSLEKAVSGEWGMIWLILLLIAVNYVLGVWRPRFVKLRPHPTA